jgi:hypothetical protein
MTLNRCELVVHLAVLASVQGCVTLFCAPSVPQTRRPAEARRVSHPVRRVRDVGARGRLRDTGRMPDDRSLKIVFDPGMTVGDMTVRLSPQLGAEFRELLSQEGISYGEVIELSTPAEVLDALAPYLTGGGFLLLRSVIVQLIRRNQGKKFRLKVRDHEVEADGYSSKELEDVVGKFIETLDTQAQEDAEAWNRWKKGRDSEAVEDCGPDGQKD